MSSFFRAGNDISHQQRTTGKVTVIKEIFPFVCIESFVVGAQ
jgi:hypothetical protein